MVELYIGNFIFYGRFLHWRSLVHPAEPHRCPRYSDVGSPPNVETWTNHDSAPEWIPPACTGWTSTGARVLVALAGSFHHSGSVDDLLSRFGAVSTLRNIHYWSVTDKNWDTLITDASALAGPDAGLRRPDFTAAEMKEGDQYLVQYDNRSSSESFTACGSVKVALVA